MSIINRFYTFIFSANLVDGIIGAYLPLAAAASGSSALTVGILSFFSFLPWLLSAVIGVYVDTIGSARFLLLTTYFRAAALLLAAVLAWAVGVSLPVALSWVVVAFIIGLSDMSTDISAQSHAFRLNSPARPETVYGAVATLQTISGMLIAPAVAGVLASTSVIPVIVGAAVVSALLIPLVAGISTHNALGQPQSAHTSGSVIRDAQAGLTEIRNDSWLGRTAWVIAALNIASAASMTVATVYIVQHLALDPAGVGFLFSAIGAASAMGGVLAARYAAQIGFRKAVVFGGTGIALTLFAPALSSTISIVALVWAIGALFSPFFGVSIISHRQKSYDPSLIGRINGAFQFIGVGIAPLGGIIGGALASIIGLVPTLWLVAGFASFAILSGRPWQT
ncbi:Major Facilitator Superfamily transporter [Corynebacterium mustelae]|uniref:Major Facilitator Superfamily transporter n=1 Tax=Corynebacterium mustelae TaxID=571915 RepID=A0A0G3H5M5_9CORY|nr:MFS transporter [Corynebacterium mustelae]AKK06462.1 Major Facilitator Superfamily transporter [Corynebacterium mustelae]